MKGNKAKPDRSKGTEAKSEAQLVDLISYLAGKLSPPRALPRVLSSTSWLLRNLILSFTLCHFVSLPFYSLFLSFSPFPFIHDGGTEGFLLRMIASFT